MPLNIEPTAVEHPDVTALKQRIIAVTKKYTDRHGWCAEARNALREAGVLDEPSNKNINVEVTFTINGSEEQKASQRFRLRDLTGKSHEQQLEWVRDQIATPTLILGVPVTPEVVVLDLNESSTVSHGNLSYPEGYTHIYVSNEGRVAHLLLNAENREGPTLERWISRSIHYTLCGTSAYRTGTLDSPRAVAGKVCAKCLTRAENSAVA